MEGGGCGGIGVRREVLGEVGSPAGVRAGGGGWGWGELSPWTQGAGCETLAERPRKAPEAWMAGAGHFHNYYIIQPMLH